MKQTLQLTVAPPIGYDPHELRQYICRQLQLPDSGDIIIRLNKRSIDARSRNIKVNLELTVYAGETPEPLIHYNKHLPDVSRKPAAIIVGAGPAGLFAALRLIELGIKPIVLERGKDVRERRRDLAAINQEQYVNPESNYCFGEGGAGTYSDGKLYTRSKKRGDIRRVLEILVAHGADELILAEAHPHIGTNKLPKLVAELRESILKAGGEIHFNTKVTDLVVSAAEIKGVVTENNKSLEGLGVILATGHSARDIFELLFRKNILLEAKPFALGVRIEHQQQLIDHIQYHGSERGLLPAAPYALVEQVQYGGAQHGVFSFCMCPGGFIVPAATNNGEVVVNGMSPSKRDSQFANSGIVVSVDERDWKSFEKSGPLAGMYFQQAVEQKACQLGGNRQTAPAQRMLDFVQGKVSASLLETSYQPGLHSVDMRTVLPEKISYCLQKGFKGFGQKMRGYLGNEAQIVGVESRTSSPVKIPRDRETHEHVQLKRLFPCAEGAGYAGGIMSAAMDGERCAEALVRLYGR